MFTRRMIAAGITIPDFQNALTKMTGCEFSNKIDRISPFTMTCFHLNYGYNKNLNAAKEKVKCQH